MNASSLGTIFWRVNAPLETQSTLESEALDGGATEPRLLQDFEGGLRADEGDPVRRHVAGYELSPAPGSHGSVLAPAHTC